MYIHLDDLSKKKNIIFASINWSQDDQYTVEFCDLRPITAVKGNMKNAAINVQGWYSNIFLVGVVKF